MKIVHVITRLIVGGAQENTLLSCEGLKKRGHDVYLVTGPSPGREGSLMERALAGGYTVILEPHLVRSPHPWHDARAFLSLRKLSAKLRPDIWHTHSSKAGILGRSAVFGRGPVVVHTIHGLPFHPYQSRAAFWLWSTLERYAARRCDKLVVVADAMARQALAQGVGRPEQFVTIHSGMELDKFKNSAHQRQKMRESLKIPADRIVFGTIARLQPLKGHADILKIAPLLVKANPHIHFLWIGDGIFYAKFTADIQHVGLASHFTLTGLLPPDQVGEVLPAMDVVIHPSYREGLPRALPQAMLAGLPTIAYDCDGAGEVCRNEQTGLLIPPGDITALRHAIEHLADNAAQRCAMGEAGRTLAENEFSADDMVLRLDKLYHQLLAEIGRRPS